MTRLDGGQLAARRLAEAGVQHLFTVSGGPLNPFYSGKPACVHVVTRPAVSPETLWGFSPEERARQRREA